MIIVKSSFFLNKKIRFQKVFCPRENEKPASFKLLRFEERKIAVLRDLVLDGRPNRRNKAAFLNSSCVLWKEP